jgi:hypothetical protein
MTKLVLVVLSVLSLVGCGDAFTAGEFSQSGVAGVASAGAVGTDQAGSAGLAAASGASQAIAGSSGATSAGAGDTDVGGVGGATVAQAPCAPAIDTTHQGYLALQGYPCYRTKEIFDTIYCGGPGWATRTLKVNGRLVECNTRQTFAPTFEGYNYFEIEGSGGQVGGSDWLRWSVAGSPMSCWTQVYTPRLCDAWLPDSAVTLAGHNYICSSSDCVRCATDAAYAPGGSAHAWTDEGACE